MKRILTLIIGAAILFSVSSAFGQVSNVPMYFNGGYQGNVWGGGPDGNVATGFYDGSINNVNVGPGYSSPGMVCDDYFDHITTGENWTATGYQVSSLNASNIGNTLFGGATGWGSLGFSSGVQGYEALAYLVNDMFTNGVGNAALQSSISQALWYLTSNAVTCGSILLSSLDSTAQGLVAYVQKISNLSALSTYTNLWLYTQPFNPNGPQEMWGEIPILVPEGSAALMYLLLAGVSCMGAFLFRSRSPRVRRETL